MRSAYDVLGVGAGADREAIRGAYVSLAKELHPDRNRDDPRAKQRFQEINRAYELLRDPEKRSAYDQAVARIRAEVRRRRRHAGMVAAGSFALTGALSALLVLSPILGQISPPPIAVIGDPVQLARNASLPSDPFAPEVVQETRAVSAVHDGSPQRQSDHAQTRPHSEERTGSEGTRGPLATADPAGRSPEAGEAEDSGAQRAPHSDTNQAGRRSLVERPEGAEAVAERARESLAMLGSPAVTDQPSANPEQPRVWITYHNERFGFALDYPADVFAVDDRGLGDFWRLFVSHDGRARLLVTAGFNARRDTPASYRRSLMSTVYAAASLEYAPLRTTWFVLAGTRGEAMFYERATFACDGRTIHGWRLTYPAAARDYYRPIIERMHQGYKHARGASRHCGAATNASAAGEW